MENLPSPSHAWMGRLRPRQSQNLCLRWLTGILGPAQDGSDLVPLSGVAPRTLRGRAHSHSAFIGLHPTQVGSGSARAVGDLSVGVVCLQVGGRVRGWAPTVATPSPFSSGELGVRAIAAH